MPLYAVCFVESAQEDKLISVVEANSKEEALHHHFRKYVCTNEVMKEFIVDLSLDGFYCMYFDADFNKFKEAFADTPSFIELMEKAIEDWTKAEKIYGCVPDSIIEQIDELLTEEICIAVANYLIKNDLKRWTSDAVVVEVEIERT